jgi:hypothetical protein
VRLGAEVVNLVGLQLVEQADQAAGLGEVAVVQEQLDVLLVPILVDGIE